MTRYSLAVLYYSTNNVDGARDGRGGSDDVEEEHERGGGAPRPRSWRREDGWLTSLGVCQWHGVICDERPHAHLDTNEGSAVKEREERGSPEEVDGSVFLTLNLTSNGEELQYLARCAWTNLTPCRSFLKDCHLNIRELILCQGYRGRCLRK